MPDFEKHLETLYSDYKDASDKIENINKALEAHEKKSPTKLSSDMELGLGSQFNAHEQMKRHLTFERDKAISERDSKLKKSLDENDVPKDQQDKVAEKFNQRYEKEKLKDFDKSQDYMESKRQQTDAFQKSASKDLDQSQEYASKLMERSNNQRDLSNQKDANNTSPTLDTQNNYDYSLNLSFNQMEQNLELSQEQTIEPTKETDKEADIEVDQEVDKDIDDD